MQNPDYFKVGKQDFNVKAVKEMGKEKFKELFKGTKNIAPYGLDEAYHMITGEPNTGVKEEKQTKHGQGKKEKDIKKQPETNVTSEQQGNE
jgi:hypothetical protein